MIAELLHHLSQSSAGVLAIYYCLFIGCTYTLYSFLYDFNKLKSEDIFFNSLGIILFTPPYFLFFTALLINKITSFIKFLFKKRFNP